MTISGNGYGAKYERAGAHPTICYELTTWTGEEYGPRSFTSVSGLWTLETAMRLAGEWCESQRASIQN